MSLDFLLSFLLATELTSKSKKEKEKKRRNDLLIISDSENRKELNSFFNKYSSLNYEDDVAVYISDNGYVTDPESDGLKIINDIFSKFPSYDETRMSISGMIENAGVYGNGHRARWTCPFSFEDFATAKRRDIVIQNNVFIFKRIFMAEECLIPTRDMNYGIRMESPIAIKHKFENQMLHEFLIWWDVELRNHGCDERLLFISDKNKSKIENDALLVDNCMDLCVFPENMSEWEVGTYFWWPIRRRLLKDKNKR